VRVSRRFSKKDQSPYMGVAFRNAARDGSDASDDAALLEFPAHWSADACDTLESLCLVPDGVPACVVPVSEDDVPAWLWRREADSAALKALPAHRRRSGETSARQVFDRIAGALAYQGWKAGYFDAEADARAFFDELRTLLCRQLFAPEIVAWRSLGLWWAYGMAESPAGCAVDSRTGKVVAAGPSHAAAHGAFIHGVSNGISAEGGVIDLWRRESSLLTAGLGSGANLTRVGRDEARLGSGTLIDHLRLCDGAAALFRNPEHIRTPGRTVVVDADHPEVLSFIGWKGAEAEKSAATLAGSAIMRRHVEAIVRACRRDGRQPSFNADRNPALRLAIAAARQAMVPDTVTERAVALVREGRAVDAGDIVEPPEAGILNGPTGTDDAVPGQNGWHLVRMGDDVIEDETLADDATLLDSVAAAAWSAGATGILFADAAASWNGCANGGEIRAVAGDGDFVFIDDTACGRAVLNLAGFLDTHGSEAGELDVDGFVHAVRLATVALDIAIALTVRPTPRLARRSWDFRPVGLGLTNVAAALMARGIPYDSDAGRTFAAAACALASGAACATSAEMADELGAFPAFAANRDGMLRVLADHRRAATGSSEEYVARGWTPLPLRAVDCPDVTMIYAACAIWDRAMALGTRAGLRNAQLTLIPPAEAESALLDCATRGIAPETELVRYERLPGGGFRKAIKPAVPRGLRALGYDTAAIDAIVGHIAGRCTLSRAPGVNHESLRRHGFTDAALGIVETALEEAPDIRFAFDRWTLGDRFCTDMLGFSPRALDDPAFDVLSALGYSEKAVDAANAWCCGTDMPDGAPHLDAAHVAVFDCVRPLGERGRRRLSTESRIRMMAAVQPFVSGGIGHAVTLSAEATIREAREALLLGWRLGLKSLALERDGALTADPYGELTTALDSGADAVARAGRRAGGFAVIDGGRRPAAAEKDGAAAAASGRNVAAADVSDPGTSTMSQALAIARALRSFGSGKAAAQDRNNNGIDTGGEAAAPADAETSRQRSSHMARGAASVPSSADAVVEQRQV